MGHGSVWVLKGFHDLLGDFSRLLRSSARSKVCICPLLLPKHPHSSWSGSMFQGQVGRLHYQTSNCAPNVPLQWTDLTTLTPIGEECSDCMAAYHGYNSFALGYE